MLRPRVAASPPRVSSRASRCRHPTTVARRPSAPALSATPGDGGLVSGLRAALGFFRERVDAALADGDEALISRVVAPGEDGASARWGVDLNLFVREPVGALDAKTAKTLERASLTLECAFAPRDANVYPSRGAAGVEPGSSRFFAGSGVEGEASEPRGSAGSPGSSAGYWIADEPGFFKFALEAKAPVVASGVACLPPGIVYFNAEIDPRRSGNGDAVALASGVATVKRDVPASFMGAKYDGILAEYVVVGTFTAERRN